MPQFVIVLTLATHSGSPKSIVVVNLAWHEPSLLWIPSTATKNKQGQESCFALVCKNRVKEAFRWHLNRLSFLKLPSRYPLLPHYAQNRGAERLSFQARGNILNENVKRGKIWRMTKQIEFTDSSRRSSSRRSLRLRMEINFRFDFRQHLKSIGYSIEHKHGSHFIQKATERGRAFRNNLRIIYSRIATTMKKKSERREGWREAAFIGYI